MIIYLMGSGRRLQQIRDALELPRQTIRAIGKNPETFRFSPPEYPVSPEDLIIVSEFENASLRVLLDNLLVQELPAKVVVFTAAPIRTLLRDYPGFIFSDEKLIYRNELRGLVRRAAALHKVETIRSLARGFPLLTVIWGNPDPDAIASACALGELVQGHAREYAVAYMGEFTRPENTAMVSILRIPMRRFTPDLLQPDTIVATVDAQPSFFKSGGPPRFDIVVDHHPPSDLGDPRYADVRPNYGSTSTIFSEYFHAAGLPLSRKTATALFYGLKVDTGSLTRNVSDADVDAFRHLRMLADENMVRTIELSQLPVDTLDYFAVAIAKKRIIRDVAFAYLGTVPNPDICVHVADFFIKLSGISWAVLACRSKERVVVIFRSDGFRKHAGHLAEALFTDFGSAGGHRTMARAELELPRLRAELPEASDAAIESWLLKRLGTRLRPLASQGPSKDHESLA
jgi:nanoRNase/pAp phosphatase (c-di-AMP/oligoRNAs hydrolase)